MKRLALSTAVFFGSWALAQEPSAEPFASFQKIDQTRVGRTIYEFTYQAVATTDLSVQELTAVISSDSDATKIIDGEVSFGNLQTGETRTSGDTFSFSHNVLVPFDPSVLTFAFSFATDEPDALDLDFTVAPEPRAMGEIGPEGGVLSMVGASGIAVEVDFPELALTGTESITLREVTQVDGLPAGFTPLTAVALGPSGTNFLRDVPVTFALNGQRTPGALLVAFLSNDAGDQVVFPLMDGTGPEGLLANISQADEVTVLVPHFSVLGLAEVLAGPDVPGLPPLPAGATDEEIAKRRLQEELIRLANEQLLTGGPTPDFGENSTIVNALRDWFGEDDDAVAEEDLQQNIEAVAFDEPRADQFTEGLFGRFIEFIGKDELGTEDFGEFRDLGREILSFAGTVQTLFNLDRTPNFDQIIALIDIYESGVLLTCWADPEEPAETLLTLSAIRQGITGDDTVSPSDNACFNPRFVSDYFAGGGKNQFESTFAAIAGCAETEESFASVTRRGQFQTASLQPDGGLVVEVDGSFVEYELTFFLFAAGSASASLTGAFVSSPENIVLSSNVNGTANASPTGFDLSLTYNVNYEVNGCYERNGVGTVMRELTPALLYVDPAPE